MLGSGTQDATAVEPVRNGTEETGSIPRSASETDLVVQMAETCYTNRGVVRYRPRWLHPNPEECFWLCVDAGWQAVIALSSGEAEYYGLVRATSQMLGLQSILPDWGWKSNAHVWMDATTGIATESRRGLGRVKHIDTVFLWVQTMVTEGEISLGKTPTKEMLADFVTKHADAATMLNCVFGLGLQFQSGECKLTLKA